MYRFINDVSTFNCISTGVSKEKHTSVLADFREKRLKVIYYIILIDSSSVTCNPEI